MLVAVSRTILWFIIFTYTNQHRRILFVLVQNEKRHLSSDNPLLSHKSCLSENPFQVHLYEMGYWYYPRLSSFMSKSNIYWKNIGSSSSWTLKTILYLCESGHEHIISAILTSAYMNHGPWPYLPLIYLHYFTFFLPCYVIKTNQVYLQSLDDRSSSIYSYSSFLLIFLEHLFVVIHFVLLLGWLLHVTNTH